MVNMGLLTVFIYLQLKGISSKEHHKDIAATLVDAQHAKNLTTELKRGKDGG